MLFPAQYPHSNNQNWLNLKGLALSLVIIEFHKIHPGLLVVLTDSVHHSRVLEAEIKLCSGTHNPEVLRQTCS